MWEVCAGDCGSTFLFDCAGNLGLTINDQASKVKEGASQAMDQDEVIRAATPHHNRKIWMAWRGNFKS